VEPTPALPLPTDGQDSAPRVRVFDLRADELPLMDVEVTGGSCDPYLTFALDPPAALLNQRPPQTTVIKRSRQPAWPDEQVRRASQACLLHPRPLLPLS
jgi:hypothetical protein